MQFRQLTVYTYRYLCVCIFVCVYICVCGSSCVDLAKSLEARVALGKWVYREMINCKKKNIKKLKRREHTPRLTQTYSRYSDILHTTLYSLKLKIFSLSIILFTLLRVCCL